MHFEKMFNKATLVLVCMLTHRSTWACPVIQSLIGYENEAVDLTYTIDVSDPQFRTYQVSRFAGGTPTIYLTVAYLSGALVLNQTQNGIETTGNLSAGDLSIRIPSMNNISLEGLYILRIRLENITCIDLVYRARPNEPLISNTAASDDGRQTVGGVENKDITLICTSTGGYPKPNMAWFRTSNRTTPLATNVNMAERDDRTYQLTYTFNSKRTDDGALFICQSSYDPPDPLYIDADVYLYLRCTECQLNVTYDTCATIGGRFELRTSVSNGVFLSWKRSDMILPILYTNLNVSTCGGSFPDVFNKTRYTTNCDPNENEYSLEINEVTNGDLDVDWIVRELSSSNSISSDPIPVRLCACKIFQTVVRYEKEQVDLVFNTDPPMEFSDYMIKQFNGPRGVVHLIAQFDGDILIRKHIPTDVESIGNITAGNMSIRIPSVNKTFTGIYIFERRFPSENITCIKLIVRARPSAPVISNTISNADASLTVGGVEDQDITLICTSTGRYSKPHMTWYRTSNLTNPLIDNANQTERGDKTYQLTYTFRAKRADDGALYICLTFFEPPAPLYMSTEVNLNLSLKPSNTRLTIRNPLTENQSLIEIAECTTDGFKPDSIDISWILDRTTTDAILDSPEYLNITETFRIRALYRNSINREDHGKALRCVINHITLDSPLELADYLIIQYAPDVMVTTSNVTVNDSSAVLNCIPSGRPEIYTFSEWQHNWPGYGTIKHNTGLGNDPILSLSSLTYEYSGIYNCSVSNGVSGSRNPNAGYGTIYLQVETFPIITLTSPIKIHSKLEGITIVLVEFYSNRMDNKIECFRGRSQTNCSSQMLDGDISLPVFGTIIQTRGIIAKIAFTFLHTDQYGLYTIKISNGIGASTVYVEVVPTEVPSIDQANNTGAIVGGSVGGGVAVLIGIVLVLIWMGWLRKRQEGSTGNNTSDMSEQRDGGPSQVNNSGINLETDKGVYYNIEINTYEELHQTNENSQEYGTLNLPSDNATSSSTEYENLQLRCQNTQT